MSCFMGEVLFEGVIYLLLCIVAVPWTEIFGICNVLVNYAHMVSAQNSLGSVERQSGKQAVGEYQVTEVYSLVNKAHSRLPFFSLSSFPPSSLVLFTSSPSVLL